MPVPDGSGRLAFSTIIESDLSLRKSQRNLQRRHGIGYLKRNLLELYSDPARLELMLRIKRAFDPQTLLNFCAVIAPSRT